MKVKRTFTPEPLSPAQEEARLLHKLALIEDRIAARDTLRHAHFQRTINSADQLGNLYKQREIALKQLSQIRGAAKETLNQQAPQGNTP